MRNTRNIHTVHQMRSSQERQNKTINIVGQENNFYILDMKQKLQKNNKRSKIDSMKRK